MEETKPTFFITMKNKYLPYPILDEIAQFRKHIALSKTMVDREDLVALLDTPIKLASFLGRTTDDPKFKMIGQFARKHKICYQDLIMTLGADLQHPVNFVIGYDVSRYLRAFLDRCDIPFIDVSRPDLWEIFKQCNRKKDPLSFMQQVHDQYDYRKHFELPEFTIDNKGEQVFQWVPKLKTTVFSG